MARNATERVEDKLGPRGSDETVRRMFLMEIRTHCGTRYEHNNALSHISDGGQSTVDSAVTGYVFTLQRDSFTTSLVLLCCLVSVIA